MCPSSSIDVNTGLERGVNVGDDGGGRFVVGCYMFAPEGRQMRVLSRMRSMPQHQDRLPGSLDVLFNTDQTKASNLV